MDAALKLGQSSGLMSFTVGANTVFNIMSNTLYSAEKEVCNICILFFISKSKCIIYVFFFFTISFSVVLKIYEKSKIDLTNYWQIQ